MAARGLRRSGVEAGLKRAVMRYLEADYPAAVVRKRHGSIYSTAGDPDIYFLLQGIHVECELKQVGKEPTPLQQVRLAEWAAAGALTATIHTVPEMRAFMEAHFSPPRAMAAGAALAVPRIGPRMLHPPPA